ncbi:hypothetical protein ATI53_102257 [Salipiger aestuarii]|uniref:DDE family transposase n=1 Tax=Salipiger aestuarii TaxID=568098 RepID=A0A327Y5F0_9RHOB|nr:hypothetical protein ATI53_102257 [Salipiger aestuarii]
MYHVAWAGPSGEDGADTRVESKMSCIKRLSQTLMSTDFDRQVAEIHVRIAVLNRYTALGIPVTVPAG